MIEKNKSYVGGCLCGAIRYALRGPSLFEKQCCCRDCQKATGTGHTTIIGIHRSQLSLQGSPTVYTNRGETGGAVSRHFCGACGGRLYTSGDLPGEIIMVQAGSLDDPNVVEPQSVIYMKQAVRWDHFDPNISHNQLYDRRSEAVAKAKVGDLSFMETGAGKS
jgi:hypothetical protein